MTWIEKEVPSLELCKKLKGLGFPQGERGFYWVETGGKAYIELLNPALFALGRSQKVSYVKAPTCRELGEWLPPHKDLQYSKFTGFWKFDKDGYQLCFGDKICFQAENEVTVRAKMLIWLVENKYMDFKKEG